MDTLISYIYLPCPFSVRYRSIRKPAQRFGFVLGGTGTASRPKQRLSAGACRLTAPTRSWKICSFAFRAAPNTAQSAPHRFPRSEHSETVGRLRPRSDHRPGGAGSRNQQPQPFPPTFGISCTVAKAGKSRSAKIIRVSSAPQLHRGAIRAELWRVIFAAEATGRLERRCN